ncbi:MAG: hypothetical protein PHV32_11830, partial [Eubacteriales bacterium]|nr:hypothetical protein [Eubacteriales bacterium]
MKFARALSMILVLAATFIVAVSCSGRQGLDDTTGATGLTDSTGITTGSAETTEPLPTEPRLIEDYRDAIIVAADTSNEEWKSKADYICTGGELPEELRKAIRDGNAVFMFAPGEYLIEGPSRAIYIGTNTTVTGAYRLYQPYKQDEMLYPDPELHAIFMTKTELPSTEQCNDAQFGLITTNSGAKNIEIRDIALSGYTVLKLNNTQKSKVSSVLI